MNMGDIKPNVVLQQMNSNPQTSVHIYFMA